MEDQRCLACCLSQPFKIRFFEFWAANYCYGNYGVGFAHGGLLGASISCVKAMKNSPQSPCKHPLLDQ